jgi:pimeloyl-ACP methyl ester carboxylesterase
MTAIVLVHGGFVDGSGWEGVYQILKEDGYSVSIVQNPTITLAGDVAATKRVLDAQSDAVVLVGHSYGGAVITEAGNHPSVVGLVYIAAFAPDKGESVNSLIKDPPPGAPVPPIVGPQDGFLALDKAKFAASFAGDVPKAKAAFMADSQVPWGVEALAGAITEPAWKSKPSWYLVTTDDKMIPPPAQRLMSKRAGSTVVEVAGSHSISSAAKVAALIEQAAKQTSSKSDYRRAGGSDGAGIPRVLGAGVPELSSAPRGSGCPDASFGAARHTAWAIGLHRHSGRLGKRCEDALREWRVGLGHQTMVGG